MLAVDEFHGKTRTMFALRRNIIPGDRLQHKDIFDNVISIIMNHVTYGNINSVTCTEKRR
jgi:hypothetical protein